MPDTSPKEIAVAILNWNGLELLKRFLPSVLEYSQEAQIYIIDNGSNDGSEAFVAEAPDLKWIANDGNYGYAGGYNRGLAHVEEELVVLLNSDIEVTANWLRPILELFHSEPKAAAVQPKILDLKKPELFEYAGASGGYIDELGYPFCRGRIFYHQEKDEAQYEELQEVFWASGACLAVRQSVFKEVGGLNELLFAHMEEIDLCWRMQLSGYRIYCEPKSTVFHLGGGTLNKLSPRKTFLNFRNNLIILLQNLPTAQAFSVIFSRLILDGIAAVKFAIDGMPKHTWAVLRAHLSFYRHFPQIARRRPKHRARPLNQLKGVYKGAVVYDFFARKKRRFSDLDKSRFI